MAKKPDIPDDTHPEVGRDGAASPQAGTPPASQPEALSREAWEKEGAQPWKATPQGRLAIRLVTRGVLGSAFFTVGGALTTKWLQNYNSEAALLKQDNPLAFISKLVDMGVGKPIEAAVNAIGKDGARAVTFRPTGLGHTSHRVSGRSLGHEVSAVSFDFFCASIGDAWGRDIAGWIDPNVKKDWMKDGKIEWPAAIKQAMKSTWRYVTYNGGEDWAVAIPYVYFMRGHRALLDHASPGFKYDFDHNLNGGSSKVSGGEHVGNFNRGGIMDLQHRFVVYNMGTVAYRELYTFIGEKLQGKQTSLYGAQDKEPPKTIGEKLGNVGKWMVRSVVKAGIYMTPAVPFFWITRTPQTKFRGLVIDPEHGALAYDHPEKGIKFVKLNEKVPEDAQLFYAKHVDDPAQYHYNANTQKHEPFQRHYVSATHDIHSVKQNKFNPNAKSFGTFDAGFNTTAKVCGVARKPFENAGAELDKVTINGQRVESIATRTFGASFRSMANTYVNSAISYTPYMYAKAEFANLWDDGKMDMSIERAIDGAVKLNFGEFKSGLREIGYSILHKPLPDADREREAQRRIEIDESAADVLSETKGQMNQTHESAPRSHATADRHRHQPREQLSIRERVVAGRKEDAPVVGAKRPKSYAEAEEMRRMLEELQPPTNSIN